MGMMLAKYLSVFQSKHPSSSKKHYPTVIEELCHQFSLADLRKSTNNFDENRIITGTIFSTVYKGCLKHNGAIDYTVILKRMKNKSDQWKFKKEIEFHCQLRHPNLVSLIGFCDHKDEMILVYEYMSNGSLYHCIRSRDTDLLSWKKRLEICIGAAQGLHYLHTGAKRTIFHCDIKPHNILLDNNMVPKLSHLGFSLQGPRSNLKPKPIQVDNVIGSFGYMAPEFIRTNTFIDKCDVYSFGMVLLEVACTNYKDTIFDKMIILDNPDDAFHLMNPAFMDVSNFLQRVSADKVVDPVLMTEIAPECLAIFMDVTQRCLNYEPNERPIMGEVKVELERALALQEEADARNCSGDM